MSVVPPSVLSSLAVRVEESGKGAIRMFIDCGTCAVRDVGCADCVVTVLLGEDDKAAPVGGMEVGFEERHAIAALAQVGLVPHLRHTPAIRLVS